MHAEVSVPLIYIGGPLRLRVAARRYLLARGWRRWTELAPCGRAGSPRWARWSRRVLEQALQASQPGQVVLILAPPACYRGWARRLARRGRRVQTPLENLSLGQMLWQLLRALPLVEGTTGEGVSVALQAALEE